jgi:hypothetical protein
MGGRCSGLPSVPAPVSEYLYGHRPPSWLRSGIQLAHIQDPVAKFSRRKGLVNRAGTEPRPRANGVIRPVTDVRRVPAMPS